MTAQEFIEKLPAKINSSALEDKETVFHFDLSGDNPTQKTVEIKDGSIDVSDGLQGEPKCVVSGKSQNFVKVVTGKTSPMTALMMGKVKVSNTGEMMKYAKLFGIM